MVYLYDACDQISDFCHQQLLRKMWRKISWTDGRTDRGKTVYPPPHSGSGGIFIVVPFRHHIFVDILSFNQFFVPLEFSEQLKYIKEHIFRHIFLSNYWWQKSDIWSQASYRYPISWEAFLDPSDFYFLFADLVDFYTHWTYMHIFRHIFLSNYWWQRSDKKNATKNILDGRKV
jgi:hypothetical protein